MTPNTSHLRHLTCAAALTAALAAPTLATSPIGQVIGRGAQVDGIAAPPGTTIYSSSRVTTASQPVVLHLTNGQSLNLAANSSAELHATADAGVELRVAEGNLALRAPGTSGLIQVTSSNNLQLDARGRIAAGETPGLLNITAEDRSANTTWNQQAALRDASRNRRRTRPRTRPPWRPPVKPGGRPEISDRPGKPGGDKPKDDPPDDIPGDDDPPVSPIF